VHLVPLLVSLLSARTGRDVVQSTLVSFGPAVLEPVAAVLRERTTPRAVRAQLPMTLARFGTTEAADALVVEIESGTDGLVRYKAIRALGRLVAATRLKVDRVRVEKLVSSNLEEYFRLLGLRGPFDRSPLHVPTGIVARDPTERILLGLLNDKIRQALERAFRLLKIAHPLEDIHRVHMGYLSDDKRLRANAAEFLDTLLSRRDQTRLRELIGIAEEASIPDAVTRARALLHHAAPSTREEALDLLARDRDATVSALARLHAAKAAGKQASVVIGSTLELAVGHA
jgi:HEAT repeat protein